MLADMIGDGELNDTQEQPIEIPAIFATLLQLESVNKVLTANFMALAMMVKTLSRTPHKHDHDFDQQLSAYKEQSLKYLDTQFQLALERSAGKDRQKQVEFLIANPEAILFSGMSIKQQADSTEEK